MNKVETALVASPPRRWLQRWYETPTLIRLGGLPAPGSRALELGCGSGYGTQLILERFGADHVDAVDLDPAMIRRAQRRLDGHADRVCLAQGSATDLPLSLDARDGSYDAVFDFGIIHHIPNWRDALDETVRVLKPGGRFYFDEVTAIALASRTYRLLFDHPEYDRFTAEEFVTALQERGLAVDDRVLTRRSGRYVLGVARRTAGREAGPTAAE
ncbi:MAG: methyltransferase domain-containing protein [Actinophytocola sp.]|nr:methyltransferase domain-containing protein [Actinophytocola sp.]